MWNTKHWHTKHWNGRHWLGASVTRRVIKWYERIRPTVSWIMKGTPCQ